jgi:hypothetical protein
LKDGAKMKKTVLIVIPIIFLLNTCALEIANVIGPGGGYVFYDKGNYEDKWRYIECSPFDIGELKVVDKDSVKDAMRKCREHSGGWYTFEWELPDEAQMKKMLECFSYGLTRFSPDYYYLSVNQIPGYDKNDPSTWEVVILHKNFDNKLNGEVEKVNSFPDVVKIRPIRKF